MKIVRTSTPRLGPECSGLICALERAALGDAELLEGWFVRGRPALVRALRGLGLQCADAEDATQAVLERVWSAVLSGRQVREELPWLARVVRNIAFGVSKKQVETGPRQLRADASDLGEDPAVRAAEADEILSRKLRIDAGIDTLPEPYRTVGQIRYNAGATRRELVRMLIDWSRRTGRSVGAEQARVIVRETGRMLRAVLAGTNAEMTWPRRFSKKNRWDITPPPPPFERDRTQNRTKEKPA